MATADMVARYKRGRCATARREGQKGEKRERGIKAGGCQLLLGLVRNRRLVSVPGATVDLVFGLGLGRMSTAVAISSWGLLDDVQI